MHGEGEKIRETCRSCSRRTNHTIVKEHSVSDFDEAYGIHYGCHYQIIQCLGCETVTFREAQWQDDEQDEETGRLHYNVKLHPRRTVTERIDRWKVDLPDPVGKMYREVVNALNGDAPTLATVGMRALAEAICKDQGCTKKNLDKQIEELVSRGVLANAQADHLHIHRFMGNKAVHQVTTPPWGEMETALRVLETLIQTLYELPQLASKVTKLSKAKKT